MSHRVSATSLPALSDERLLSLASRGHERAFETFVQRYRAALLAYCRRRGLSQWRAEEVLQQALLQVWLALRSGTEVRDPKSWLYRIVHNGAVNAMRRTHDNHARLTEAIHDRAALGGATSPQGPLAMREALDEVVALPQMQREAVLLTAIDGQTHREVAGTLGISDGAVRGLLYRARATLRGAAGAIAPESLVCWLSGGASGGASAAERVAELSGAGGAVWVTGALLKGAVVAVSAGILVGGAALGSLHFQGARRPHAVAQVRGNAGSDPDGVSAEPGLGPSSLSSFTRRVAGATGPDLDRAVGHARHPALSPQSEALPAKGPALPGPGGPPTADPSTGLSSLDQPGSAAPGPARSVVGDGSAATAGGTVASGGGTVASGGDTVASGGTAAGGAGSPVNLAPPEAGGGVSPNEREGARGDPPQRSPGSSGSSSEGDRWGPRGTEKAGGEQAPVEGPANARRDDHPESA
jgi:RNA polymerase sigma-70 factor (ECF subfamily)